MAEDGTATPARPLVGILFVVLATLAFALSDTITKHLAMLYPVPVVMAVRYLVNLGLLGADHGPAAFRLDAAHGCVLRAVPPSHAVAMRHLIKTVRSDDRTDPNRIEEYVVGIIHGVLRG